MITRPNGKALTTRKGIWHIVYYQDGVRKLKSTGTEDETAAVKQRNKFFRGAPLHEGQKSGRYIYRRKPFFVRVKGVYVGEADTEKEAERMRDKYLASL